MTPIPDKRAYLALRGGFPPEIIDAISEFQTADDQGMPNSILCSEMRDKYDRPAHKKIRRMLPFTTFWGIEAFATEDSGGMFVNLLLDHKQPYFAQINDESSSHARMAPFCQIQSDQKSRVRV